MLVGIDYGSKLAGTTVIAFTKDDKVHFVNSEKKKDADQMILQFLEANEAEWVGIDAPLSLPKVYSGQGSDFFYRTSDKAVKAMSPMFLGGLTARAMKLNAQLNQKMLEVYPGALARELSLKEFDYKGKAPNYPMLIGRLNWDFTMAQLPASSHQMDAILALYIVWKIKNGLALQVGAADEGLIYF